MVRRKHLLKLIAIYGLINAITITYGESTYLLLCSSLKKKEKNEYINFNRFIRSVLNKDHLFCPTSIKECGGRKLNFEYKLNRQLPNNKRQKIKFFFIYELYIYFLHNYSEEVAKGKV